MLSRESTRLNPAPAGASKIGLRKRTLTSLYNQRPTRLANAHAALDRAVWAAYGWNDDDPEATGEGVILGRLLALNGERAADRSPGGAMEMIDDGYCRRAG